MSRRQFFIAVSLVIAVPVLIWWELLGFHTRFAPGYSEERFAQLVPGQPRERVLELLGEPLQIVTAEVDEEWCYQHQGDGGLFLVAGGSTLNLATGEWCVRFSSEGVLEGEFRERLGELNREGFRLRYGPPEAISSRGLNERFIYSEPARDRANWEWREVVVQAGKIQRLISYPVNE